MVYNFLKEMLVQNDVPFNMVKIYKQVRSATLLNYKRHFFHVKAFLESLASKYAWFSDKLEDLLKMYYLRKDIKKLLYSPNESIKYTHDNSLRMRLVFTSINKAEKYSLDDYEHFTTPDGVVVYYPYLAVCANITNGVFKSMSIYTIGFFSNIPPDGLFIRVEPRTTIKLDIQCEPKEVVKESIEELLLKKKIHPHKLSHSELNEMFMKYIKNTNVDLIIPKLRSFVLEHLPAHIEKVKKQFDSLTSTNKYFQDMNGFKIEDYFNSDDMVRNLNFSHDFSSDTRYVFSNHVSENRPKVVFVFFNGIKMCVPILNVYLDPKKGDKIIIETIIIFEFPEGSEYYLQNGGQKKYLFTVSSEFEDKD